MTYEEITKLCATQVSKYIKDGTLTVLEVVEAQIKKIKEKDQQYGCYLTITQDYAKKRAEEVQAQLEEGKLKNSNIVGVPIAIKDNICTKMAKTTCGSKLLQEFVPPYNATVIDKLEEAGAIIIGKVNMDEFAMGSTTETSAFKRTKNPWNIEHVPGGSSGGAAACVSSEEAFLSLGSDTGGSIRQPSSYCGVVGLKPTYGLVSRYGLVAYASSLDQIGPIGRSVTDCAALLEVIAGHDAKDSTSLTTKETQYTDALVSAVRGMKIGIPKEYLEEGIDLEVKEAVLSAAKFYEEQGATVEFFELKGVRYAVPAYYILACAEASSNLSRYDGVKYGYRTKEDCGLHEMYRKTRSEAFGSEVKRRMMIGAFVLSSGYYDAYYKKALQVKSMIKQTFDEAFGVYDAILGPTAPTPAPRLGESLSDPLKMYLSDIYTVSVNLAGLPAISVPYGISKQGLPIGVQLIGKHFGEKEILRLAYTLEQSYGVKHLGTCEER